MRAEVEDKAKHHFGFVPGKSPPCPYREGLFTLRSPLASLGRGRAAQHCLLYRSDFRWPQIQGR